MEDEGYRIIDSEAIGKDLKYEPPLIIAFGVDDRTTRTKTITMGRTIIPPKGRNQRHHHVVDATFYILKGRLKLFMGRDAKEYEVTPGHFVYIPAGVLHGLQNMSETENAELVFTYGNCPNKQAAETHFVEKPWV
jgi:quercetin dioxygenase-like cupin family protein